MASTTVKGTYSLDPETVRILAQLARRWGVSKSEVLRRSIRNAAADRSAGTQSAAALKALDQLQNRVAADKKSTDSWATRARAERRATARGKPRPK